MKSMHFFYIVILLALSITSCSSTATQTTPSAILFSDDFSNTDNKWSQVAETGRSTDYYNNAYRIFINDADYEAWAIPEGQSFTDVRIEVETTKSSGPDDNDFGVICRYTDESQFYYALISSDGYYGILKMTSGGGLIIGEDNLLESNKINQGSTTNQIRFDCVGSKLTLYVNGSKVDQQTDSEYTIGNVGFIAGTYETGGTDILFDNLIVYKP
jgi:hypothetical protein